MKKNLLWFLVRIKCVSENRKVSKFGFFSGDQMKIYKVILSPFGEAFNFEFYSKLNR